MFKGLFDNLTPESFISGRWLLIRRTIMIVVAIFNVLELYVIFGVSRFLSIMALFAEVTSALIIVLLFLASFFIYLIGYKTNITTISIVTGWVSEVFFFYFTFITKIWQVHAGVEVGFYIALVLHIINTVLLAVLLMIYYKHKRLVRANRKKFNIFD